MAAELTPEDRTTDAYAYTGLVAVNRNYAVNGLNQYTTAGPAGFCYDANGNLTADGTYVYKYDIENRLLEKRTQVSTACPVTDYAGTLQANLLYDPLGRLFQVDQGTIPTIAKFLYDGDALIAEFDGSNAWKARYVHGSNAAADDPLVWYVGAGLTTRRYLHADRLGSIVAATNPSAAPTINSYDEYGIPGTGNVGRFQYTGQIWLAELGMYYYKARIYSPTLGRFLQVDPIGYDDQINLYAYVGNDPINANDPSGLQQEMLLFSDFETSKTATYQNDDPNAGPKAAGEMNLKIAEGASLFLPMERGLSWLGRLGAFAWYGSRLERALEAGKTLVLYSKDAIPTLRANEAMIKPLFGWSRRLNDRVLSAAMRVGRPIRDSFVDKATGKLLPAKQGSELLRERNQLLREGWKFNEKAGEWRARNVCIGTRIASENPC